VLNYLNREKLKWLGLICKLVMDSDIISLMLLAALVSVCLRYLVFVLYVKSRDGKEPDQNEPNRNPDREIANNKT